MSKEFEDLGTYFHSEDLETRRVKAVQAALVLINTRLTSQPNLGGILENNNVSLVADKIEEALNNTK
ncbi:MAG: hypothetical protein HRT50_11625 [Colwellia sp.]|uniref:hypothetical protein n=1 Tax=Colwellia sp. TaxID=56799 RepID=UPI001DD3A21A|nr:hypothetical protein [Colwellia sp.]NQY49729.1 hypothetical protein [Colwellia sp.]